jgi:hypothetical protein
MMADGRSIAPVVVPILPTKASGAAQSVHAYQPINALVIPQQLNWFRSGTNRLTRAATAVAA